ncbi:Response regulator receiver domain-containing protein [Ekhidna lutea]|uniref:Response regulator receiver domain-containing protein n=1 Tax=Ekhidna lutea TaxID=447679 RepID=A0A239MDT6_EKHLU|nr:response regulator [Ekhidna lutea]SNT39999.1 Response regulator receiver domain-containing protein [Ekhidna lutea]
MSKNQPTAVYLDDCAVNLLLFREMFKDDFNIMTTQNPKEALDYVLNNNVDYLFTDHHMPDMTGIEFLQGLSKLELSNMKKVIVSAQVPERELNSAFSQKLIDQVIDKPWTYSGLKSAISTI